MSTSIKPPRRNETLLTDWHPSPDQAPSLVRQEQPTTARVIALIGLFLILLGMIPVLGPHIRLERTVIDMGQGFFAITSGLMLVLVHAFIDRERVFRRIYAYLGLALIGLAIILRVVPVSGVYGARFATGGFPALLLGLVLLIATIRLETDRQFRSILLLVVGLVGAVEILATIAVGVFAPTRISFLAGEGAVHLIMGLFYVGTYIGLQESDDAGYYAALGLGAAGAFAIAGALFRSLWPESIFLVPNGLILIGAGLTYLAVAAGRCLDWPIVVLTRRELSAYFYSPVAYLVLIGMLLVGWFFFWQFAAELAEGSSPMNPRARPMFEPIVAQYIFSLIPVIVQIFFVPVITMRLLSEEQRTGTLEVLLTAPVNESTVVLSKFLAGWMFYLITWLPWWLYLVSLATLGGTEFDYRPLLSFNVTLLAVSAGFIAMGLFFSALTQNQIIAAVLTFVGMIGHLAAYLIKFQLDLTPGSTWFEVLSYVSFLDLWLSALRGVFAPRFLVFHLSVAVFFLYATIKLIEARKWK